MSSEIYEKLADSAVPEPVVAGTELPIGLTQSERSLYKRLLEEPRGRLEQEFLPVDLVHTVLIEWANG